MNFLPGGQALAGQVHLFELQMSLRRGHRNPANTHRHPWPQKSTKNISKLMGFADYSDHSASQRPQERSSNMDRWVLVLNKQDLASVRTEADAK